MSAAARARNTTLHLARTPAVRTVAPLRLVEAVRANAAAAGAYDQALVPPAPPATGQQPWSYRNRFTGTRPVRVPSAPALVAEEVIAAWRAQIAEALEAAERVCAGDRAALDAARAALRGARMPAPPAMRGWAVSTARSRAVCAVWDRLIEASRSADLPPASAAAIRRAAAGISAGR